MGVTQPSIRGKRRGWVAQHRTAGVWKGGFRTNLEAAEWLAAQLKVSVSSLLRGKPDRCSGVSEWLPTSSYRGVIVRKRKAGCLFETRVPKQPPKTFRNEQDAAAHVARCLGVPVKTLKKCNPFTRRLALRVWSSAFGVFKRYRPGDLVHLLSTELKFRSLFEQVGFKTSCFLKFCPSELC